MNSRVKKYLPYISLAIVAGILLFVLVQTVRAKNTGFETKSLWDWMELLVIPLFLAGGALYLNRSERESERQRSEERSKLEREIATDRQQEAALQSYLDRMADLLLKEKLRTTKNKEVRDVARTRTLSVLRGLDGNRKGLLLRFLQEAKLINKKDPIVNLQGADLSDANLYKADLRGANLSGVNLIRADLNSSNVEYTDLRVVNLSSASLSDAKLIGANLDGAKLYDANLSGAYLTDADLSTASIDRANLSHATMRNANLILSDLSNTNLAFAELSGANLSGAYMGGVDLREANLSGANLNGAEVISKQLATALSLKEATMPDGTKHE